MAFLGNYVDPNAPAAQDFAPVPSGEYPAIITDSDMKPTKKNDGQYLELTYQIIDGPYKGRLVWGRLNLDNPNAQAVAIAQGQLNAIVAACGITAKMDDSQQLHNIPHVIRVEFVAADGGRRTRDGNEIKAWKRIEGAAPAVQQQQAAAPAAAAPPWAQKAA